jgi:hypothetical protein
MKIKGGGGKDAEIWRRGREEEEESGGREE